MSGILIKKCLRWLGLVRRIGPGRIPKDLLYSSRLTGSPLLCYKDCKKDIKLSDIYVGMWESCAKDCSIWYLVVRLYRTHRKPRKPEIKTLLQRESRGKATVASAGIVFHLQKI